MPSLRGRSDSPAAKAPPAPISDRRPHMAGAPPTDVPRAKAEADVVEKDAEVGDAQIAALGKDAPQPTQPYPMSVVTNLVKAINDATAFLSDGKIPPIAPELPERVTSWNNPLPPEVYAMTKIVVQAVKMADKEGKFATMMYDPAASAATPDGLRDMTGKLMMMARNTDLKAAVSRPNEEVNPAEAPSPAAPETQAPPPPIPGGGAPADEAAMPAV